MSPLRTAALGGNAQSQSAFWEIRMASPNG